MSGGRAVLDKREVFSNRWIKVIEKDVFSYNGVLEHYYSIDVSDYVTIFAQTFSGHIPLVKQYRPAVEKYTLELPAGMVNKGEQPQEACIRELREETGLEARQIDYLGVYLTDTGRMSNNVHVFKVQCGEIPLSFSPDPEEGLEVIYVDWTTLCEKIETGEFSHQLHIAAVMLAVLPDIKDLVTP